MVYERFIEALTETRDPFDAKVAKYVKDALELRGRDVPLTVKNNFEATIPITGWTEYLTVDLADQLRAVTPSLDGDMDAFHLEFPISQPDVYREIFVSLPTRQKRVLNKSLQDVRQMIRRYKELAGLDDKQVAINDFRQLHLLVENKQIRNIPSVGFFAYSFSPPEQESNEQPLV